MRLDATGNQFPARPYKQRTIDILTSDTDAAAILIAFRLNHRPPQVHY